MVDHTILVIIILTLYQTVLKHNGKMKLHNKESSIIVKEISDLIQESRGNLYS